MSKADWDKAAATLDLPALKKLILTESDGESFPAQKELFKLIGKSNERLRVLDYGCGLGRNIIGMVTRSPYWKVTGADVLPMVKRAQAFLKDSLPKDDHKRVTVQEVNADLFEQSFDAILMCFVLQHIAKAEAQDILVRLQAVAPLLVLYGRRWMDDGTPDAFVLLRDSGWIIERTGWSEGGEREDHFVAICRSPVLDTTKRKA